MTDLLDPPAQAASKAPASPPPPPTSQLIADVADDAGALYNQHLNLLQSELRDSTGAARGWWLATFIGVVAASFGLLFVLIASVRGLAQAAPGLPEWATWLIVGGALLVLGGAVAYLGCHFATKISLIPTRTLKSLSETWSWLSKRSK